MIGSKKVWSPRKRAQNFPKGRATNLPQRAPNLEPTLAPRMCRFINLIGRHLMLDQNCISLAQNYMHRWLLQKRRNPDICLHNTAAACLSLASKMCNSNRRLYQLMDVTFHFKNNQKKTTPKQGTCEAIKEMEQLKKAEFELLTALEFCYNMVLPYKELYETFERLFPKVDKKKLNPYFQSALNFLNDFMRIGGVVKFSSTDLIRGSIRLSFMMREQYLKHNSRLSEKVSLPPRWMDDLSPGVRQSVDRAMDKMLTHYETCLRAKANFK